MSISRPKQVSKAPSKAPSKDFNHFLDRAETRFLGLAQSPVLEEFLGRSSHLSEDELSALFALMMTALRHTAAQDQEAQQQLGLINSPQDVDSFLRSQLLPDNDEALAQSPLAG